MLIKSLQVFFIRGFGAGAGFLVSFMVAHTLNVTEAGYFFLSLALISLIGTFITLGSPTLIIKLIGSEHDNSWIKINNGLNSFIFYSSLIGLFIVIFCYYYSISISRLFDKPELVNFIPTIAISALIFSLLQIIASSLQGRQEANIASLVQNVTTPIFFISVMGGSLFFNYSFTALDAIYIYSFGILSSLSLSFFLWFKDTRTKFFLKFRIDKNLATSMAPLFVVMIMTQIVQWSGQLATGRYLSVENVAYFSVAQRTALLATFVLIAVNLIVAPKFANAFAKNNLAKVNELALTSSKSMLVIATPILIFMLVLPDFLMSLFGENFIVAAPILQILAIGQFINVISGSVGYLLNMTGHEKDFRNIVLISGPLALILAFILTKHFGLYGAAYATAISVATQNLLAVWMVKKRLGFNPLNIFRTI